MFTELLQKVSSFQIVETRFWMGAAAAGLNGYLIMRFLRYNRLAVVLWPEGCRFNFRDWWFAGCPAR